MLSIYIISVLIPIWFSDIINLFLLLSSIKWNMSAIYFQRMILIRS